MKPFVSKLFGVLAMSTILAFFHQAGTEAASPGPVISLMIDGKGIPSDVQPVMQNNRMLVPIRVISENTGKAIIYDQQTRTIHIENDQQQIQLTVGKRTARVAGQPISLDTAPIIVNNRTFVPIRFVSELFGFQVDWDARAHVAKVTTPIRSVKPRTVQTASTSPYDYAKTVETSLLANKHVFPLDLNSLQERVVNTYGDGRSYGGGNDGRKHEGIDLVTYKRAPVYAMTDGRINRIGWNEYGGWRINITSANGNYYLYYAHLDAFAPTLRQGNYVKAGQLIGFVGDSGYGPRGTEGKFVPHLHVGLYYTDKYRAANPYNWLKHLEQRAIRKQIQ